jgi:HPt (histidine-containing phosphotransfer) domain-containing protein
MSNNNKDFISEMVNTFIQTIPASILEINNSLKSTDWKVLSRSVHKIKPSITLMGLHAAKSKAIEIETALEAKKPTAILSQSVQEFCALLNSALVNLKKGI